jgi:hypothetical protein
VTGPNLEVKVEGSFPVEVAFGEQLMVGDGLIDLRAAVNDMATRVAAIDGQVLWPPHLPPLWGSSAPDPGSPRQPTRRIGLGTDLQSFAKPS